eukprot:CAMPEP_0119138958 /NCGR_PEP_ID=MMETSP1310-20130426/26642_1 /TAXON_ID=464262 /ORGANISM="Genus nov. species nov., Strain RCC2339" /LENGTH=330 /DNA_ID=CAMNT_0007130209 /DNA_START=381 /DNA_END=1373 /DNA_ORIENTATION=-
MWYQTIVHNNPFDVDASLLARAKAGRPVLAYNNGRPVAMFCTEARTKELTTVFQHSSRDVWVCTYPKSGTTWFQYVVHLLSGGEPTPLFSFHTPWMEAGAFPHLPGGMFAPLDQKLPCADHRSPTGELCYRVFKSHWWYADHMASSDRGKVVYMIRNGLDVAVSFYHHTFAMTSYMFDGTFDEFFELFMEGDVDFGDYWDHVLSWWARRDDPNVLVLFFEDSKQDPANVIRQVAEFMDVAGVRGLDHAALDDLVRDVVEESSFANMKELSKKAPMPPRKKSAAGFFRKGVVGDSKNYVTGAQYDRFVKKCEEKFDPVGLPWRKYLPAKKN